MIKTFVVALSTEDDMKIYQEIISEQSPFEAVFAHSKMKEWYPTGPESDLVKGELAETLLNTFEATCDEVAATVFDQLAISIAITQLPS